jgi:hypothetical protein
MLRIVPEHLHNPKIEKISERPGQMLLELVCQSCRAVLDSRWVPAPMKAPSLLAQMG